MSNAFDSTNYPSAEPTELVVGDRWAWKRVDLGADYPPASYTLSYSLRLFGTGTTEIEITASGSGSDYLVEVAAADTAAETAGSYAWQAYITRNSDSERITVDRGTVLLRANRDASTDDPRSHAQKMLDAIEALMEGRASSAEASYSIGDRSLTKLTPDELIRWRNFYRAEVRAERQAETIANGGGNGRLVRQRYRV